MLKNIFLLHTKMTLAISTLKNISPLHTKMQDYHLKYPNVLSKCHNKDIFSLKEFTHVDEEKHIGN